ncbi:hypothetical protein HID58_002917, partial [Brassica napus]
MEITFRFNETDRAAFTINASGGFTINVNPIGLPVPPANELNVNGAHVHPPSAGGVKEKYESENPKHSDPSLKMANPRVFFDMTVGGKPAGDIIGGGEEPGGECIYGSRFFDDENFIKTHSGPGILTMWNCRENTNGSQFMICLRKIVEFDQECVAFGQVVEGLDVIQNIEKEVGRPDLSGVPNKLVVIADCAAVTMSGGKFTVNFNPVGPLVPPAGSRLNDNGSHVHPQASGGFTINVNPLGQFVPLAGGGLNVNKAHVHPPAGGFKKGYGSENTKLFDPSLKMANPRVFFDMTVDGKPAGRIVMELFADTTPRTAENFRALCTGEKGIGKFGKPLHYKGSIIHEVFPGYTLCGGDIIGGWEEPVANLGRGEFFDDENFIKMHTGPGILTMWDCRPNTNGSQTQFMICLRKIVEFDGECVLFGQVVEGLDMIENIEK